MRLLKKRSVRVYVGFIMVLALTIGGSAIAAFADSGTGATVGVSGGTLSESAPTAVAATPVTLSGDDQTTTYSLALTVNDPRGTAAGWHMTMTSTTFTGINPANTLSTTASSILGAPSVSCISGGNHCTSPDDSGVTYPYAVPAGSPAPAGTVFFDASSGHGLGKFSITPTITVSVPANAIADTYSSTVSIAISTGP